VFFSNVPAGVALQTGDGPFVRWTYRDSSLRSYFMNAFDLAKSRRGPYFFFEARGDSLVETTSDPMQFYRMALGAILSEHPESAREMLRAAQDRDSSTLVIEYWRAWVEWDLGRRDRALDALRAAGVNAVPGPTPEVAAARAALAQRDTARAMRLVQRGVSQHALDPEAHGLLADLALVAAHTTSGAELEAYAARLLAPDSPISWRRWAFLQVQQNRALEGARSLRRYFDLGGPETADDGDAQQLAQYLSNKYPITGPILDRRRPGP
jgi:tetratricopeptide (TPR) repeat protein